MKRPFLTALLISTMLASACVPIHVGGADWPATDGRIVDVVTGKPIAGATVKIHGTGSDASATTTSDANGMFHFSRHLRVEWKADSTEDTSFPAPVLSITAAGYGPFENTLDGSMSVESIPLAPSR